jgi:hypothetical protein
LQPAAPEIINNHEQTGSIGRSVLYLVIVLLIPLLAFLSIFPIARTGLFIRTSKRSFWHAMEYQFSDRPEQCDVVIFGDSTALMGADPRIIEARTGLKTCNFGLTYLGLATTGNLALDHYLAAHKAPKFIVMEILAAHLRPPALDDESGIIDGFLIADRKLHPIQAAKLFLGHPKDSFYFAAQLWKQLISFTPSTSPDLSQRTYQRDITSMAEHEGYLSTQIPGGNTDCFYQFHHVNFSRSYIAGLRRYETKNTKVLIWPSPVRHCDTNLNAYKMGTAFLGVPAPLVFDDDEFVDAQHLSSIGVKQNSEAIADAILQASKPK